MSLCGLDPNAKLYGQWVLCAEEGVRRVSGASMDRKHKGTPFRRAPAACLFLTVWQPLCLENISILPCWGLVPLKLPENCPGAAEGGPPPHDSSSSLCLTCFYVDPCVSQAGHWLKWGLSLGCPGHLGSWLALGLVVLSLAAGLGQVQAHCR